MDNGFRVLIVDDDASIRKRCVQLLHMRGYDVEGVSDAEVALSIVKSRHLPLVIADIRMPGVNGLDLLEGIKEISPATEVIMITGYGTVESAIKAIRLGAYDYIMKPFDMDKLLRVVENVRAKFALSEEVRLLKDRLREYSKPYNMISTSAAMRDIYALVEKVAPIDCNVLIQGESGTGKGLLAKAVHRKSPRSGKPFVVVDCAALSETLLESELFGHRKGAFTGAYSNKDGYFKIADGGTILLDEVSELSIGLQGKLLRMAQERQIIPVGSTRAMTINTRIIAATNRNIEQLVREGKFREDLFFRLNVVKIEIPPLRERKEDIPPLVHFFLDKFKKGFEKTETSISDEALRLLELYDWPGNVRELENLTQHLVIVADNRCIGPHLLPERLRKSVQGSGSGAEQMNQDDFATAKAKIVDQFTRNYLVDALRASSANVSSTARKINLKRSSLQRMMKRYAIGKEEIS
jgi:DNA-binding NtrC family response regulator